MKTHTTYVLGKRSGDVRDWQVLSVCSKVCNKGWMRKFVEDPARPVLQSLIAGGSLQLMPKDQVKVASWAALKAMVAEYGIPPYHFVKEEIERVLMMAKKLRQAIVKRINEIDSAGRE